MLSMETVMIRLLLVVVSIAIAYVVGRCLTWIMELGKRRPQVVDRFDKHRCHAAVGHGAISHR